MLPSPSHPLYTHIPFLQQTPYVTVHKYVLKRFCRGVFGALYIPQTLLTTALAFKRLRHIPLGAQVVKRDGFSLPNISNSSYNALVGIKCDIRIAGVVAVK
ncbi:hypothetical protein AA313_de0210053 [Arthrobotrys entomopaga]|nr:hypothetical protein AA313_de0210053 [Arthrobotrys entomopaga]